MESMKLKFDTLKAHTLPIVALFKGKNKRVEIDTRQDHQTDYDLIEKKIPEHTDQTCATEPLTERAEILRSQRPWPEK